MRVPYCCTTKRPTRAVVRRKYKGELGLDRPQLWAYRSTRIAAILILALLVGWLVSAQTMLGDLANQATFNAIHTQEYPTVVGIVTALVLIFILANLAVDLLYAVLDPRIRYH